MPCQVCGARLLLTQPLLMKSLCPECYGLIVIDRDLALSISTERLVRIYDLFLRYMRQFKKTRLIMHIVWQRERYSRHYFDNYPEPLDLSMTVVFTYLIALLMKKDFNGTIEADEHNTLALVRSFSDYLGLLTEHIYLQEGYAELVATESFTLSSLTPRDKLRIFKVIYNEDYVPLLRTFANNEIFTDQEGRKKTEEYRQEWETIRQKLENAPRQGSYRPRNFIKTSYELLNSFYCGLLKNVFYANTFDLANYGGVVREPLQILRIASGFMAVQETMTVTPLATFREALRQIFKGKAIQAESILLSSSTNADTFPLFPLLAGNVFISHRMTFMIFLLLHPLLLSEYFHDETVRRSRELERERAKAAFESAGFKWVPNVTDKKKATLEIDGLAGRNGTLFVVEVKARGLTTFYEHRNRRDQLIRDLRGVVDGKRYKMKDGRLVEEKIPSLLEKMEYAKLNMSKHGFDSDVVKNVIGVIVIRDFPPITDYKGVRMIGLEDVPSLE